MASLTDGINDLSFVFLLDEKVLVLAIGLKREIDQLIGR